MKIFKRLGILLTCSILCASTFLNCSFAETKIGTILPSPEEGWTRYSSTNENIIYVGTNWSWYESLGEKFSYHDPNSKIKFSFTGTSIRILSSNRYDYDNHTILIDNKIVGTYANDLIDSKNVFVFEKKGLENRKHFVEIIRNNKEVNIENIKDDAAREYFVANGKIVRFGITSIDLPTGEKLIPYDDTVTTAASLDMKASKDKVRVGEVFTVDAMLKNVSNVYATDFKVNYNNTLFEFAGYEEIPGYKVYNKPVDDNGNIRFIVASQGKTFPMNNEVNVVKLKFRAKSPGLGKVDALKGRLADTEKEFDLDELNCLEDEILVEAAKDVNRTGEYTLLDLSIDAYYFGMDSKDTDKTKHDADQDLNEKVDDVDLTIIVNQILENKNYKPNN